MAKFMVKASEFKNVCKAVNDRKLAELKKEIIEILKKQDEKEFKKATDYLNSQEEHFSHLEKSLSGKWIEKAGYGIGTVRVWKGKKYKKIASDKWVRIFDKEGRGTNIAIGKLIAKVQKIDNVEDLMAFVQANKQRFVDENGVDLPVLDKLRAAVDARNNGGMGSKEKTKKLISDYTKINEESLRKYAAKLKGSKEDKLNYLLETREKRTKEIKAKEPGVDIQNHPELDALGMLYQTIANDKDPNKEYNIAEEKKEKPAEKDLQRYKTDAQNMTTEQLEYYVEDLKNETGNIGTENIEERKKIYTDELNKRMKSGKSAEKEDYKIAQSGKLATQKQVDYATEISDKYSLTREEMLKKPITAIQKYANTTVEDFDGGIDKFIEYMADGRSEGVSLDEVGKEFGKLINHNIARKIWKDYESGALEVNDDGIFEPKKEKTTDFDIAVETAVKQGNYISSKEVFESDIKDLSNDLKNIPKDKLLNNLSEEYKFANSEYQRLDKKADSKALTDKEQNKFNEYKRRKEKAANQKYFLENFYNSEPAEKKEDENKTYWIQDSRGNRLTNEDAKKRIQGNLSKIIELESGDEPRKDMKIRDLKLDNEYLKERLDPDDRKEFVSKVKKSLFDGFLGLELLEEDINDEEKDKEEESLWNDYSAEQPELFNSTAMKVREALDRINNQVL